MLVVANYKMNGNKSFHQKQLKTLNKLKVKDTKIVLCPSFVYLPQFKLKNTHIFLGAQDISQVEDNKSTGQVSAEMLKEFGVCYVIIGHSERRKIGETDEQIALKIKNAIEHNIVPIICVGENAGEKIETIKTQLKAALKFVKSDNNIVIAYEPVWAIGSGKVPTVGDINLAADIIRKQIEKLNLNAQILYGGSVDEKNFVELKMANIDGFLLGKVSRETEKLAKIILGV